jgi:hypothetical protein
MNSIILTENNIEPFTNNSKLRYTFRGEAEFKNSSIALSSIHIYYSWFNINSSKYNNNTFAYMWFDLSGNLTVRHEVYIPDGFYSVKTLNEYFQSIMRKNGHYLLDNSTGKYGYFLELTTNSTYYAIELNIYAMMTSASASTNYTKGSATWDFPGVPTTPQIIIGSSNFKTLIGFNEGSYPTITMLGNTEVFLSSYAPRMNPVSSIFVKCSLCYNKYSDPDNILHCFTSGDVEFGGMISIQPPTQTFVKIRDQSTYDFTIEFLDQDLKQIDIKDPQMTIVLSLLQEST